MWAMIGKLRMLEAGARMRQKIVGAPRQGAQPLF
jgi:hypothetical protein